MKKSFLTSIAILAATLASNASASLPEAVSAKLPAPEATVAQQDLQVQPLFVLVKPNEDGLLMAYHSSHASHASHASHVSSRH
jgi:hypothetical protein